MIGGYLFSPMNDFDHCFAVENDEENLCGFAMTIYQSEKYDQVFQRTWIEQLEQKYPNVDQVKAESIRSSHLLCDS